MIDERPKSIGKSVTVQVIVILVMIAILVAIIVPVFATDGWPATRVSCLSYVKQLNLATIIYASDNNDVTPPSFSFDGSESQTRYMNGVMPYTKNGEIFLCPKEQKDIKETNAAVRQEGIPGKMDYVHCLSLRGVIPEFSTGKRVLSLAKIMDPAKVPYLRDTIRGYGTSKNNKVIGFLSPHGGGFNTAFLDGHAKYVRNPNISTDL